MILLAGGTGRLGSHLINLIWSREEVRVLTRAPEAADGGGDLSRYLAMIAAAAVSVAVAFPLALRASRSFGPDVAYEALIVQLAGRKRWQVFAPTRLHPLQDEFSAKQGLQCGFCTPGMLMRASEILAANPDPSPAEVREAIASNLCRCTGYQFITEAVLGAAERIRAGKETAS